MSDKIKVSSLRPVTDVKRVYSGKPGCACGCRGKYYPNDTSKGISSRDVSMFKRVQKLFETHLDSVYTWESSEDQFIALDLSPTRTYTIYYQV